LLRLPASCSNLSRVSGVQNNGGTLLRQTHTPERQFSYIIYDGLH
jgi:hypothetical protein